MFNQSIFSVGKKDQNAFMSKTFPFKYEVGYAAIGSWHSKFTFNTISMQTHGYNYEFTKQRVTSNFHVLVKE